MSKLAFMHCDKYEFDLIYRKIKEAFLLTGGLDFTKGKTVLLKPNLLAPVQPEKAVTTHPLIVKAVARLLKESGANVIVGDSPGIGTQEIIYDITGIKKIVEEEGIALADFKNKVEVSFPNGKVKKSFTFAKAVKDADYIFTIPKLKTHGMTYFTGAIKNQFGLIPGLLKPKLHYVFSDKDDFSDMLVDINMAIKPSYAIMDAVFSMEGNGPRNGTAVKTGAILISRDLLAVDIMACQMAGIDPKEIKPIVKAGERAMGEMELGKIEVVGDDFFKKKLKQISREIEIGKIVPLPNFLNNIIKNILLPKPKVIDKKCILCKECYKVCPAEPKAIEIKNGKIKIDKKKCIRCFCCQEMCPVAAIESKYFV